MMRLVAIGVLKHVHKADVERDRMAHFVLVMPVNGNGGNNGKHTESVARKNK